MRWQELRILRVFLFSLLFKVDGFISCLFAFFSPPTSARRHFRSAGRWTPFSKWDLSRIPCYLGRATTVICNISVVCLAVVLWCDLCERRSFTWWSPTSGAPRCAIKPGQMFAAAGPVPCSCGIIPFMHSISAQHFPRGQTMLCFLFPFCCKLKPHFCHCASQAIRRALKRIQ